MNHLPARRLVLALGLALATLSACGGPSSTPATPTPPTPPTGGGAEVAPADGPPFDQEGVRETLAAMPVPETCRNPDDDDANLAALLERQGRALGEPDDVNVTFKCIPVDTGRWQCEWSVLTDLSPLDPDDPCSDLGATGFQIITTVDDTGALVPDTLGCVAPG
jgi:hypothetical protein